jgi:hypothetical protein
MIEHVEYGGKSFKLHPYSTIQERDLILYTELNDTYDIDHIFYMLGVKFDYTNMSKDEKIALLYKIRAISVGDTIELKYICNSCGKPVETSLSINDIIEHGDLTTKYKELELKESFSDNISDYTDYNLEELDIDIYEQVEKFIEDNKVKFNFFKPTTCPICNNKNVIELNEKLLYENLSEDTLTSFYKCIDDMTFHGGYTKLCIDSMLPFERSILYNLLLNKLDEMKGS